MRSAPTAQTLTVGSLTDQKLSQREPVTVRAGGGPTALLEVGGLRLLTDPTFDEPGRYPVGQRALVKTTPSALTERTVGQVDAVLLSHDQHPDNLDTGGRRFLASCPLVLSTASAADRLGDSTIALASWQHRDLPGRNGRVLRVTGVPAQHGPDGTEHLTGPVMGFVLSGECLPTVYVSGDNASLDVVRAIADRCGPVEIALLFAGAARTPLLDAYLTLTSEEAVQATDVLGARYVVALHTDGWEHFTQGLDTVSDAFARAGIPERLVPLQPGESVAL